MEIPFWTAFEFSKDVLIDQLHVLSQATSHSSIYRIAGDIIYPLFQLGTILGIVGLFIFWHTSSGRRVRSLQLIGGGVVVGGEKLYNSA